MSLLKFKVTGSYLDRSYYSQVFEVDPAEFEDEMDMVDYLHYIITEYQPSTDNGWKAEGSEPADGGFEIETIERLL